ncbi:MULTISPECIES: aldo/keto reductase [Brevibacterium]|nr:MULTISPECIES: aldo/keto reductase [Brevibacterium]WAL41165.1 aldo/keto reductase [Brevibacterium sp. BRM-1]
MTAIDLPPIGMGTYGLNGTAGRDALVTALRGGYTLLDSAFSYENEGAVGAAVRASGMPREAITVTSKLPGRHHAYDEALRTVEESVMRMGLDHIDLYLIHWPNPRIDRYVDAWRALIEARRRGLVAHIGVSNFLPDHIERLEAVTGVSPEVNQIELHPYFPQLEQLKFDAQHGIVTEAWSPVGRGNDVTEAQPVREAARAHGIEPIQAVLAWHLAIGSLPLPKAGSAEHQQQNLAAAQVQLTAAEVRAISALGRPDGRLKDQDPAVYEEF